MSITERAIVTASLAAGVAILVGSSLMLGAVARLAPLLIGVPTLVLLAVELARDVRRVPAEAGPEVPRSRELGLLWWLLALLAATAIGGVIVGAAAWFGLFVRIRGGETPTTAMVLATVLGAALFSILVLLLRLPVSAGGMIGWGG